MRTTKETNVKIPKTNSGITLIALVITIIVMLILVAVTITMAVNGGLFEYAGNAGTQMNGAIANEQELANLEEGLTVNQLIDKYAVKEKNLHEELCTDGVMQAFVCDGGSEGRHPAGSCTLIEQREVITRLRMRWVWKYFFKF